jgi:RNA polymerase sigma-70 factor (ECF subfamily)
VGERSGSPIEDLDALVSLYVLGDEEAFKRVIGLFDAEMRRLAFVICGDPELAADASQNAWARAWRHRGALREPGSVRSWLLSIAANEARQVARKRRIAMVNLLEEPADPSGEADIRLIDLRRALLGLSAEDRELIAVRYIAGWNATEIATYRGGTATGIRSRLKRLMDRLREELSDE